jgi:hypothetical protein
MVKIMSNKTNQLNKVTQLLSQALSAASSVMPNNRTMSEVTGDIRRAISKIEGVILEQKQKSRMSQTQFDSWWGNVQSGVAKQGMALMSAEACQKSLDQLNKMIVKEQSKLEDLEKISTDQSTQLPDQLLQD